MGIFKKFNVYTVGTTDDPADSLEWHTQIKAQRQTETAVLPTFRPDRMVNIEKPGFAEYIAQLGTAAGVPITSLDGLLDAARGRIAFFHQTGCRIADHGLEYVPFAPAMGDAADPRHWVTPMNAVFTGALNGKKPTVPEAEAWKTFILNFLGGEYADRGWAMQLHTAVLRSNNAAALAALGPDTGYDAVHDHPAAEKLARFMNLLASRGKLPKTILYSLNIKDLYPLATIMGCFQGETDPAQKPIPGKIQLGSGWWFLDTIDGMETQMRILGNTGLLSRFVGMLTDSRSFLSYPRHEYFRRILCNMLGTWAENGEIPNDFDLLGSMVRDISFRNAKRYFNVE
jgi:glucuronate isomerase